MEALLQEGQVESRLMTPEASPPDPGIARGRFLGRHHDAIGPVTRELEVEALIAVPVGDFAFGPIIRESGGGEHEESDENAHGLAHTNEI